MSRVLARGMKTATGRVVNPFYLKPADVCLEDIATALAHTGANGGHTTRYVSVAEQALMVARAVPAPVRAYAITAYANQAYLGQRSFPLLDKSLYLLPDVGGAATHLTLAAAIQEVVCLALGLPDAPEGASEAVTAAEQRVGAAIERDVCPDREASAGAVRPLPVEPVSDPVEGLPPDVAANRWLAAARYYIAEAVGRTADQLGTAHV